jgi:hypothetical protein
MGARPDRGSIALIGASNVHSGVADRLGRHLVLVLTNVVGAPLTLWAGVIISAAIVHLAITNLAAGVALLVPVTMTIVHAASVNPIVCALIVTIVIDA